MAYQGYLIKVGSYIIPTGIIKADSYYAYLNSQDLDSYRDADGVLHRTALPHFVGKVEFNTADMLTNTEFAEFMRNIRANYINETERRVSATMYIPELDDYITQNMYMSDIKPQMYFADKNVIKYRSVRFAFIGY